MKIQFSESFFLILIAAAVSFSPRFPLGTLPYGRIMDIRITDILFLFLGLRWLSDLASIKQKSAPFFLPILLWVIFGIFTTLTNYWLSRNIYPTRSFFYILKEVEYFFLYFYVFYHVKSVFTLLKVIKAWFIFSAINTCWIILQIMTNSPRGEWIYGIHYISAIGEGGPFPVGGFFLILFISLSSFLIFYYPLLSKKENVIYTAVLSGLALGIFSVMRRSSIIGIIIASVLILFIYIVKNRQWKRKVANKFFIISILLITVSIPAIILLYTNVSVNPDLLNRKTIDFEFKERMDISRTQLAAAYAGNYQYVPIGRGKAVFLLRDESHNQYVRNFVDTGLIGSLIFLGLIFMIIKRITKTLRDEVDPLRVALATGVFVSTISLLVLSLATEAFLVVRINEAYWYFMGLTMAALTLGRLKQAS